MMKMKLVSILFLILLFANIVSASIPLDNVKTYLSFDQTNSSTNIPDNSSNKNNGTAVNSPFYVTGILGNAINLSATSAQQYVSFVNSGAFNSRANSYTVNFWIKPNTVSGSYYVWAKESSAPSYLGLESGIGATVGNSEKYEQRHYNGGSYDFSMVTTNTLTAGTWYMITLSYDSALKYAYIYVNGAHNVNQSVASIDFNTAAPAYIGKKDTHAAKADTVVDEFMYLNISLTASQIAELYNSGAGFNPFTSIPGASNPTNISFVSQVPLNISSVSLFSSPGFVNITFNLSTLNRSNLKDGNYSELLYALTSNSQTCLQKVNETCVYTNNTGLLIDKSVNVTFPSQNFSLVSWFLGENILYPYVSMLFLNSFNISHTTVNLGSNDFFAIGITGLDTSPQFNIFEVMAISRLNNIVYICNGGFGFVGNPIGNQFCQEIGRLPNETNHTHNQFSAHSLIPFTVINGKIGGTGIQMQSRMYFILTGNGGPLLSNVSYINNFSNQESTRTSNNQGVTWNSQVYTADAHIHQYPVGGVNFSYLAIGNYSGNLQIAENQNFSLITVANLNPQPPIITFPVDVNISSQFINLSWSNASVSSLVANLSYYSVDLYLPDGNFSPIFNRSLAANVGLNNSFYFDVYNLNLSLGSWLLRVTVFDTLNRSSFDQERFNLSTNAYFNFTAQDNITKVNVQNWSYNVTDLNTSVSYSLTASGLNSIFNIVKGHIFLVTVDSTGYSITSFNLSSNNSIRQDFIMPLFLTNSVFITVLDEDIGTLINDTNITVSVTSSVYVTTIIITNGTYYLSNIPAGLYDFNFQAANYSTKDYFITITDRTTQALIARLGRGYSTIGTYVRDAGDNPITQALITVQRLINTSYITIGQQRVDGVGYARFSLKDGFEYLWTVDAAGYSPKQFFLRPYLANQPYKFKLALSTSSNFTTYNDFVSYAYLPKGTSLFPDVNNFSWTVISKNSTFGSNSILWFSQDCGSGLTNNSGSPSGGTILQTLNLTAFSGVLTCYYSFQVDGFSQQTLKVPYAVKNYPIVPGNLSVYQVAQDFKTDNNDEAWLGIIATFLAFVTALFLKEVSLGDGIAGTIAAAAVLTIFGFMGWLAWSMCLAIDIIVFILFSNDRSGY